MPDCTCTLSNHATSLLEAWEAGNAQRIESELSQISRISCGDAADAERMELLEGIGLEMAQMLRGRAQHVGEDDLYRGLLRHLTGVSH